MKLLLFVLAALTVVCARLEAFDVTAVHERLNKNSEAFDDQLDISSIKERNVNSSEAANGQFPYHVRLTFNTPSGQQHCSGALISRTWILTAAHCTERAQFGVAYLGSSNFFGSTTARTFYPTSIHQHTSYDPLARVHDIALINIEPVSYTFTIAAVRLPPFAPFHEFHNKVWATATGWGAYYGDAFPLTNNLNYTNLEVSSGYTCPIDYGIAYNVGSTFCVATKGVSTCHVDIGSPLVIDVELIGIASLMPFVNCKSGNPARFVHIVNYIDWIKGKTGISYQ